MIGGIGEPRIKASIVGGRSEKGHRTVQDDGDGDTHRRGGGHREQSTEHVHPHQGKSGDGQAPQNVAHTNENLAATDLIRQRTYQHRSQRGRHRTGGYHSGNLSGRCVEHLVDEDVEVHILHHPGNLTRQAKDHQSQPKPRFIRCARHRHPSFLLDIFSVSQIPPRCKKKTEPKLGLSIKTRRCSTHPARRSPKSAQSARGQRNAPPCETAPPPAFATALRQSAPPALPRIPQTDR